ncbi:metallophosphoesterase [Sphingobium sp. EM0848]|uniref:metallophosphoesterase family protein n=1 Tax=Sphingobium sp. EM0848 TaxID=2743473 RepID=UPI0021013A38|nr:metallophosphoesterase [Sphingobium sp. EM0848]
MLTKSTMLHLALLAAAALPIAANAGSPAFQPGTPGAKPAPWTHAPVADPDTIRFAVIGDRTGLARPGVFEQAVKQASGLQPEFLINVGDLIEGYTSDTAELTREWGEIEAAIGQMTVPFFYVAGNHDLGNQAMLDMWRHKRGEPYYSFVYKSALFLILDTEDPPRDMPADYAAQFHQLAAAIKVDPKGTEEKLKASLAEVNAKRAEGASDPKLAEIEKARFSRGQVDWALKTLKANAHVRWTFVLMHKPAWALGSREFEEIETALGTRGYTVIAGHNHYYKHEVRRGRDYISMGTAGAVSHQHGPGEMDHLAWITLGRDAPNVSLLRLNGILDKNGESGQPLAR